MQNLTPREEKMQAKAKTMSRKEFLKQICSYEPMNFYKYEKGITVYPQTERQGNIIPPKDYEIMRDDFLKYGEAVDTNKPFFKQFQELLSRMPRMAIRHFPPAENCEYCEGAGRGAKNSYLSIGVCVDSSNVLYTLEVKENCHNVLNSVMVRDNCDNIYQSNTVFSSSNIFYSKFITNSNNLRLCSNMIGCHDCIRCSGLENCSYYIDNVSYTKEDYLIKKEEMLKQKDQFLPQFINLQTQDSLLSTNSTGHYITEGNNLENGLYTYRVRDSKNIFLSGTKNGNSNMVNVSTSGAPDFSDIYNLINGGGGSNIYNSEYILTCTNIYYSQNLENCSYCIGCIGLKNKSFCILNKQYTKEERYAQAEKIFAQMDAEGTIGEFFPATMNPFYFNDTVAYLIDDSFTKEEILAAGYLWRDEEIKVDIPAGVDVVETQNLASYEGYDNQGNRTINPDILQKVIKDEKGNMYRIVKAEYDFLTKHQLPLPEIHWLERIKLGFTF